VYARRAEKGRGKDTYKKTEEESTRTSNLEVGRLINGERLGGSFRRKVLWFTEPFPSARKSPGKEMPVEKLARKSKKN